MPEQRGDLERRVRGLEQAVRALQELILGPEDHRQRQHQQGLAAKVDATYRDYMDRKAVKRWFVALLTSLGALNIVSLVTLLMRNRRRSRAITALVIVLAGLAHGGLAIVLIERDRAAVKPAHRRPTLPRNAPS